MDLLTQALAGAVAAQALSPRHLGRRALLCGALGGVLADADALLRIWADPALPFQWHRHFTHSIFFVPLGGALAALPFLLLRSWRQRAGAVLAATTIAYATHGPIDTCTSYGTYLLWPLVDARIAWDSMSFIDPPFTLGLLLAVLISCVLGKAGPARVALILALLYVALGFAQNQRVRAVQARLAAERGHEIERGRVLPTLGSLLVWRSVYVHEGRIHADAVRMGLFDGPRVRRGSSVPRVDFDDLPETARDDARVREVFHAFQAFADGFVAAPSAGPGAEGSIDLGDMRYSLDAAAFEPLWGLRVVPGHGLEPVRAIGFPMSGADRASRLRRLWDDLVRPGPEWEKLAAERQWIPPPSSVPSVSSVFQSDRKE